MPLPQVCVPLATSSCRTLSGADLWVKVALPTLKRDISFLYFFRSPKMSQLWALPSSEDSILNFDDTVKVLGLSMQVPSAPEPWL